MQKPGWFTSFPTLTTLMPLGFFVAWIFLIAFADTSSFLGGCMVLLAFLGIPGGCIFVLYQWNENRKEQLASYQQQQLAAYQQHQALIQYQEAEQQRRLAEAYRQEHIQRLLSEDERKRRIAEIQHKERLQLQEAQEQRYLHFLQNLGSLTALSAKEFEQAIGTIFKEYGYHDIEQTGRSGDKGVDLKALSPKGDHVIIQCKRYARDKSVGTPDLQRFLGAITHHRAQRGIFVTTSSYTDPAREYAMQNAIELVDGKQLSAMLDRIRRRPSSPQG